MTTNIEMDDLSRDFSSPNMTNFLGLPPILVNFKWADKRPLPSMTATQLPDMQSALGAWLVEFKVMGLHYWDSLYFVGCTDRHSSK